MTTNNSTGKVKDSDRGENVALYTKYRPKKFSDVLGQEHITDLLNRAIKGNQISHAYLFIGSRGTGKTSVARILADQIRTSKNDLYEIDAASNTSVDDIRSLNESIYLSPMDSKYKVYILDEVHMLSKSAFNALLKTLEEPPAHAIFILATTEPQKIPDTVISRCESYTFRTPNKEILKKMIIQTSKSENVKISNSAIDLISVLGDGSFRDTHTILQKLFRNNDVVEDHEITVEEVEKITGAPTNVLVNELVSSLILGDLNKALKSVRRAEGSNFDSKTYLNLVLQKYRAILLMKVAEKENFKNLLSEDDLEYFNLIAEKNSERINSGILKLLIDVVNQSGRNNLQFLPLEIFLVEILSEKR